MGKATTFSPFFCNPASQSKTSTNAQNDCYPVEASVTVSAGFIGLP
jgi:hypothetical protein